MAPAPAVTAANDGVLGPSARSASVPREARLTVRELEVRIGAKVLCRDLGFDVAPGECWAIVGPNGAGKSTLLATLAGLHPCAAGSLAYDGHPLAALSPRARALKRGWLPQSDYDAFPATVVETVLVGRHPHASRWGGDAPKDVAVARAALAAVGLEEFELRDARTLSGGERRRVAIASVIAQDPDLLLLDEPCAHLDARHQAEMFAVFGRLASERAKALVLVLHDLHLALRYADHAIAIGNGVARAGTADEILRAESLSALFGHPLVAIGEGAFRTLLPR